MTNKKIYDSVSSQQRITNTVIPKSKMCVDASTGQVTKAAGHCALWVNTNACWSIAANHYDSAGMRFTKYSQINIKENPVKCNIN